MLINSYAKINLFLKVVSTLPNNYHEIDTVFTSIDLFDTLKYALTKKPSVKLLSNIPELMSTKNLVYLVAQNMIETFGVTGGIEIYLDKQIPIAAGLGGGSSNAAATIRALNNLWTLGLTMQEMTDIGNKFGSDISYFLYGGKARGTGLGNSIQPLDDEVFDKILLVNPKYGISSSEAYKLYDSCFAKAELSELSTENDCKFFNSLEFGVMQKYPEVRSIVDKMKHMDAKSSMMSGSGSTCFGIFEHETKLRECQEYFVNKGYWTKSTRTITREEYKKCFQN